MTDADTATDEVARLFAARLIERREARAMKPRDLAYTLDVSEREVYRWEAGTKRGPQIQTLRRIALALATSVDYLLGLTDDADPPSARGGVPDGAPHADDALAAAARLLERRGVLPDRRSTPQGTP